MQIYNLHSQDTRKAKDFKVIVNEEYDKNGKLRKNRYVQFTLIGKHRQWPDFMAIKDFKRLNPTVTVKGLD